jgi:hypothetical protein
MYSSCIMQCIKTKLNLPQTKETLADFGYSV